MGQNKNLAHLFTVHPPIVHSTSQHLMVEIIKFKCTFDPTTFSSSGITTIGMHSHVPVDVNTMLASDSESNYSILDGKEFVFVYLMIQYDKHYELEEIR